jgi:hypothetical protein
VGLSTDLRDGKAWLSLRPSRRLGDLCGQKPLNAKIAKVAKEFILRLYGWDACAHVVIQEAVNDEWLMTDDHRPKTTSMKAGTPEFFRPALPSTCWVAAKPLA